MRSYVRGVGYTLVTLKDDLPFTKKISGKKKNLALAICAALMAGAFSIAPTAEANPILDAKDAAVSITTSGNTMTIDSTAANNLIKWVDFSIKSGEKVAFDAKNYLNYVTGSARSDIYGTLTGGAGGHVYLVNPNGILIGDGATVNVGSLYLSTRTLTDSQLNDFVTSGTNPLTGSATLTGDVINMGNLNATVISVEGNNITFKNVADVNSGSAANVTLTANSTGEIHIGSAEGGDLPAYTMNGTNKKYMYKLVNDATELQNMSTDLAGNYMLAKDVTAGNFTPLGTFTGRFDGLNHKINNLTINSDAQYVGLFGWNQGVIENVGLVGGSVTGKGPASGAFYVGSIAGKNSGTIRNVYNTGSVKGESIYRPVYVGGIAGHNENVIERAYNTGMVEANIDANTAYGGGIAGANSATIRQVFNAGNVTSSATNAASSEIGGIAGRNGGGIIQNAYNTGAIQGKATATRFSPELWAGGIVGSNEYYDYSVGTVNNAYNTGTVTVTGQEPTTGKISCHAGGLIGENNNGTLTNGYSKNDIVTVTGCNRTVNKGETVGNSSGTTSNVAAVSEDKLKKAATFAGFGFENGVSSDGVWRIYEDSTMPLLTAFLTRKDKKISETEYTGTATGDVGATYAATTYNGVENQLGGANYIKDVSIVKPKDLTVSFGSTTKEYDGNTTATAGTATLTGIVGTDDVSLATGVTANYEDKNAGTNKQVNYTNVALTGDAAKNYNLTNAATVTGTGDITAKQLTATFAAVSKTYDGTTDAKAGTATLTGVITGDTVNVSGIAAFADRNAGTNKTVNYTGVTLSGTDAANYAIANTATGNGSIAKADITISIDAVTKTYDGTTSATGVAAKVISGEIFSTDKISDGTFTFTDKNAGTNKTVTVSDVTIHDGNNGGNYNVTYEANTASTINQKDAQVTFNPITKTYDGTTSATPGEAEFLGLINADKGKVGMTADAAYEDKNVGTGKRIKYTNITLTGTEAQNYRLTQTYVNADNGTITRKALELVATPVTIAEGEATPTEWSGTLTGFVAGEGLDANDAYSFALDDPTAAAIGKYSVTGTLKIGGGEAKTSGDYGQNYTFANAASNATAFTISGYVPPTPTPTPTPTPAPTPTPMPSNDNNSNNNSNNSGDNSVINYVTPVTPVTPSAPSGGTTAPIVSTDNSPAPVSAENSPITVGDIIPEMSGTPAGNLPVGTVAEAERQAAVATRTEMDNIPNKNFAAYAEYFAPPVSAESSQQLIWAPGGAFALANHGIHLPAPVTLEINANKLIFRRLDATSGSLHDAIISTAGQADLALGTEESDKKRDAAASESTTR